MYVTATSMYEYMYSYMHPFLMSQRSHYFYVCFAGSVTSYNVTLTRSGDPPIVLTFTEDPFDISFDTVNKQPPL